MPKGKHACRHDLYGAGTGVISAAIISRHDQNLTRVLMNAWSCDVVAASACMQAFIVAPRCMQPEAGRVWQLPGRPRVTPDSKGRPKTTRPYSAQRRAGGFSLRTFPMPHGSALRGQRGTGLRWGQKVTPGPSWGIPVGIETALSRCDLGGF